MHYYWPTAQDMIGSLPPDEQAALAGFLCRYAACVIAEQTAQAEEDGTAP